MLKIEKTKFKIKFTEINIRQRMYQKESYLTLMITTEFFPSLVGENVVSGSIEAKLDIKDIHSLDDLVDESYKGDIGTVTISVNNDGVWEHQSYDQFEVWIKRRVGRELELILKTENCYLETIGTIVSLYTTSTSEKDLKRNFNLTDFYEKPIQKEFGKNTVYRYYVKE